jgi:hypothetical protein
MSEDATSQPSDTTTDTTSATEDDQAQQMLAVAATQTTAGPADSADTTTSTQPDQGSADEDKLGDNGRRALTSERQARRAAEKEAKTLRERLSAFEDAQKSELQKAQEAAQRYESELTTTRVANARLMAAVAHDLPPDLIDLLGDGTEDEIDARAKLLAEKLAAAAPPPAAEAKASPATTRPVESLTPGGKPANAEPEDPNSWIRRMAGRGT